MARMAETILSRRRSNSAAVSAPLAVSIEIVEDIEAGDLEPAAHRVRCFRSRGVDRLEDRRLRRVDTIGAVRVVHHPRKVVYRVSAAHGVVRTEPWIRVGDGSGILLGTAIIQNNPVQCILTWLKVERDWPLVRIWISVTVVISVRL